MNAAVALELCKHINGNSRCGIYFGTIISDDDSTMCSHLKHGKDSKKLSNHIPLPTVLADPSHQVKFMAKSFFSI